MVVSAVTPRFIRLKGNAVIVLGWRSLSLLNIFAVVLPIIFAILLAFLSGWWWLASGTLIAFSIYGLYTILQGTIIEIDKTNALITIKAIGNFRRETVLGFDSEEFEDVEGIDDEPGCNILSIVTTEGKTPLLQMSRHADMKAIVEYLEKWIAHQDPDNLSQN